MGKNQLRLLKFAIKYSSSWHTYGKDRSTVSAIKSLENLGLIITNEHRQFKLNS